ncbi:hypothetical protein G7054_g1758 [Neopestalotiopsis clavispora]|nr:hypothetical protein G7054_g1758 [Neopestalotiopsis clavispora]
MSTKDDSTQFQFLITCIKNSNAGKVDFAAVAEQLDIVSKGAAAKRYERLMKAHGIGPNGIAGSSASPKKTAVKKEKGAGKPPAKKRKLEEVDENAGDEDEPVKDEDIKGEVKSEVKCEVKFEDAMNVKSEYGNGGGVAMTELSAPNSTLSSTIQGNDGSDDDDVLVVSATERSSSGNVPAYGSDHHHHHHMSMSTHQHIPSIHSFDYAANLGYPIQTTPTQTMMPTTMVSRSSSGNPLPYGFAPSPYAHSHDGHHFFWQGPHMMSTHPDAGQHQEDSTERGL